MAEMKISNTLVNDDSSQVIAYARQLLDEAYGVEGEKNPERLTQSVINRRQATAHAKLRHDFDTLMAADQEEIEGTIDNFKEIELFLQNYNKESGDLKQVLENLVRPIYSEVRNIDMVLSMELDPSTGDLTAVYTNGDNTTAVISDDSKLNSETGNIELVFDF